MNLWTDPAQQKLVLQQLQAGIDVRDIELHFRTKAGELHTLLSSFETVEIQGARCIISTGVDITARKQAEEALRQSELQYHSLVDALDVSLCRWRPDTTLTYANEKYQSIFGGQGVVVGRRWLDLLPDEARAATAAFYADMAVHPATVQHEYTVTTADGSIREYQWIDTPILGHNGEAVEFQTVGVDITARKQMEEELARSEKKYRELVQFAPVGIYEVNFRTLKLTAVNDVLCQLTGYSRAELLSMSPLALLARDDQELFTQRLRGWLAGELLPPNVEYRIMTKDGRGLDALLNVTFTRDEEGRPLGATVIASDITERKRAESLIAAQRDLARLLSANLPEGEVWQVCFQTALRVSGLDSGGIYLLNEDSGVFELVQQEGLGADFLREAAQVALEAPYAQAILAGKNLYLNEADLHEHPLFATEGLRSAVAIPIRPRGQLLGCLNVSSHTQPSISAFSRSALEAVAVEIGNLIFHQRTEAALRTSREELSRALIAARMGTWRWHIPANRMDWSPEASRLFGIEHERNDFGAVLERFHPEDRPRLVRSIQEALFHKRLQQHEYRILDANDEVMWVTNYGNIEYDREGNPLAITGLIQDITELKQADQALRESEEFLKEAQIIANMGSWRYDLPADRVYWSENCYRLYGFEPYAIEPTFALFQGAVHPDDLHIVQEAFAEILREPRPLHQEMRIFDKDGHMKWIYNAMRPVVVGGQVVQFTGIQIDITARKHAEEQLRASEEKYRGLLESLDNAVSTVDADGRFLYMNDTGAARLGGAPQEFIGKHMKDIFPEPIAAKQIAGIQSIFQTDRQAVFETQSLAGANELRWYRFALQPLHDETGRVSQVLINATDIHDLKTTQQELLELNRTLEERVRERTAQVQDLYDNAPVGYHSLDAAGRFVAINQTELNWLGCTREELLGQPITTIYTPQSAELFNLKFQEFVVEGKTVGQEADAVRKDGTILPVVINATAIYDQDGNYVSSRSTMTDITARKRVENELKRNINFTNALLDAIPTPVFYTDRDGHYLGCNHAFANVTGKTAAEIRGRTAHQLWPGDVADLYHQKDLELMQSRAHQIYESIVHDKDGVSRPVISVKDVFYDEDGAVAGLVGAFVDITERKNAEDALRLTNLELERAMRVKDEFLASMSHELRTPLNAILGLSESMLEQYIGPLNEHQFRSMQTIATSGQHLLELINDILDLSKLEAGRVVLDLTTVEVREVCAASLAFVKDAARRKYLQVTSQFDPAVTHVQADARRLKQMLVNLFSNAVKFTPEGGAIQLKVTGNPNNQTVCFSITDTGIGIAPEDIQRLFQPFVQLDGGLNRQFEGTGLGLSLVARMARLHGGSVAVESELGQGSCFSITLPWQVPPVPTEIPVAAAVEPAAAATPTPQLARLLGEG